MKKSKFTEEQLIQTLRQVEAGTPAIEMCRKTISTTPDRY